MRLLFSSGLFCIAMLFYSCSWDFYAYIRNPTNKVGLIDVYLLDKSGMATLPNKVKVANRVVKFKAGYRKFFEGAQNVTWIDTSHFKFEIKPNTTVDLTDMAGRFRNGAPMKNVHVTITFGDKVQTLLHGRYSRDDKFIYEHVGLSSHIIYYDMKE